MKHLTRALKRAAQHRTTLLMSLALTLLLVLLAHPGALASDVFGNIGPAPQLPPGGWVGRYPVERYQLDQYFPAISVGFTSGVDASGVAPMIAYFGAQVIWLVTCFLANGVILLFALAFNLNLLTGNGQPDSGALAPVSQAIHSMYTSTFGTPWLVAMVTLVGCWAMWKALVQRRYTETAGALAVSLLFFVVAVGIVTQPERTIGPASKLSNQLSTALLSVTSEGSVGSENQAKTAASDQLFELLVLNPWTVLEFGGVEQCAKVNHGKARSVAVRPLSRNAARDTQLAGELEDASEVPAEGKLCINDRNKYATHFLAYPFGSKDRAYEYEALENGDDEDLPASDPAKTSGTYPLGPADQPAAEAMGKGGQYQRLLLAIVILLGETGAYLLLGALAVGVILAQILLLTLLAFAPVALLVGIFPGRGHDFFRNWLAKLAGYLARKVIYSLILAIVLAVCKALDDATSNLGWLLAFALQAAFLWAIFLQRNRLTSDLLAASAGQRAAADGTGRLANLYYATGLARMMSLPQLPRRRGTASGGPSGTSSHGEAPSPGGENPTGEDEAPPNGGSPEGPGGSPGGTPQEGPPPPSGPARPPGSHETPTHGPGAPTPGDQPGAPNQEADFAMSEGEAPPPTIDTPALEGASSPLSAVRGTRAAQPEESELEPPRSPRPKTDGDSPGTQPQSAQSHASSSRPRVTPSVPAVAPARVTTTGPSMRGPVSSTLPPAMDGGVSAAPVIAQQPGPSQAARDTAAPRAHRDPPDLAVERELEPPAVIGAAIPTGEPVTQVPATQHTTAQSNAAPEEDNFA
jgi:TrbL/VirB6 plasmid conjugal transfer protein